MCFCDSDAETCGSRFQSNGFVELDSKAFDSSDSKAFDSSHSKAMDSSCSKALDSNVPMHWIRGSTGKSGGYSKAIDSS